jgi:hypothetical protein
MATNSFEEFTNTDGKLTRESISFVMQLQDSSRGRSHQARAVSTNHQAIPVIREEVERIEWALTKITPR